MKLYVRHDSVHHLVFLIRSQIKSGRHAVQVLHSADVRRDDWGKRNIIIAPPTSSKSSKPNVVLNGFSYSRQGDQFHDAPTLSDEYGGMAESLIRNENNLHFKPDEDGVPPELLLKWYEPREKWDYSRSPIRLSPEDSDGKYQEKWI